MDVQSPKGLTKKLMAAAIAAAVVLGAAGVANAMTAQADPPPSPNAAVQDTPTGDEALPEGDDDETAEGIEDHDDDGDESHENSEVPLVGTQADAVSAAALAAVPGGTVLKVEAEDAGYEAHVMGADGIEVEVYLDADFAVIEILAED